MAHAAGSRGAAPAPSMSPVDRAEAIFVALEAGYRQTAASLEVTRRWLVLPGGAAAFEFAGADLVEALASGLALSDSRRGETSLSVRIWDSSSGPSPMPSLPRVPVNARAKDRPDLVETFLGGRFRATVANAYGLVVAWDSDTRTAIGCVRGKSGVPAWETAAPLRTVWGWWAESVGAVMAHGAAVGEDAGAVLLAAPGGSGKSTTSLACLERGMKFAGDDYVLVRDDPPEVFGLFLTAKLDPENLRMRMSDLQTSALPPDPAYPKRVVVLRGELRARFAERMPLRAVVVPRLAPGNRVQSARISPGEALRALGPSSVLQLPGCGPESFRRLARLVSRVPCYALDLAPDLDAVVEEVQSVLRMLP